MTAPKLPPDSHWTIDSGIAQSPNQSVTSLCAWRAEIRSRRWTSEVQPLTFDCRLSTAACRSARSACELLGAGLGLGAHGGDPVARGGDLLVELLRALLGLLDRGEPARDLVAQRAHARDQRRVGLLDPAQVLGPRLQVVEPVGLEQQRRGVGHPAAVDVDEAARERVQRAPQLGARERQLVAGDRDLALEPALALLAGGEHGRELGLALSGDDRLLLGGGELGRGGVDLRREAPAPGRGRRRSAS